MTSFDSLTKALDGYFDKPLCDLPTDLRDRVRRDLALGAWDDLPAGQRGIRTPPSGLPQELREGDISWVPWDAISAEQRRVAAQVWDAQHDPAQEEGQQFWWDVTIRKQQIRDEIVEWQCTATPTAVDRTLQETHLHAPTPSGLCLHPVAGPTVGAGVPFSRSFAIGGGRVQVLDDPRTERTKGDPPLLPKRLL